MERPNDSANVPGISPCVSVIVPTYNRVGYLKRALESILAQTYQDFEILVCDDASTDDVEGLLQQFGDSRIRLLASAVNGGNHAATNIRGYSAAVGRYVSHLDDDDEWSPDFLTTLITMLERHPECSVAFCDSAVIDEEGQVDDRASDAGSRAWGRAYLARGVHQPFIDLAIISRAVPTSHAAVIRRDSLDLSLFSPDVGYAWDMWVAYLLARNGGGAYYEPARLARYRRHGGQVTGRQTHLAMYQNLTFCDRSMLDDPLVAGYRQVLARRIAVTAAYWAVALTARGRSGEARVVVRAGLKVRFAPQLVPAAALALIPQRVGGSLARRLTTMAVRRRLS